MIKFISFKLGITEHRKRDLFSVLCMLLLYTKDTRIHLIAFSELNIVKKRIYKGKIKCKIVIENPH